LNGAGATLTNATTEFSSRQAELIANDPEQRRLRVDIDLHRGAVDCQIQGHA
jgi:hypothetical protein